MLKGRSACGMQGIRIYQGEKDVEKQNRIRDRKDAHNLLYLALQIGERMLLCGAEVNRVEDSIGRICLAYGVQRVDAFTITESIVVTIHGEPYGSVTQTRRIQGPANHLKKLEALNQLSRTICEEKPEFSFIEEELARIDAIPSYSLSVQVAAYALISGSFCLFFGGDYKDMAASAVIGILLKYVELFFRRLRIYNFFVVLLCSAFGGFMAFVAVKTGLGNHADKISIGNIMLLIPGVALTNAIRDMFQGDTISGLLRFCEALLVAVCVAFGFAAAAGI